MFFRCFFVFSFSAFSFSCPFSNSAYGELVRKFVTTSSHFVAVRDIWAVVEGCGSVTSVVWFGVVSGCHCWRLIAFFSLIFVCGLRERVPHCVLNEQNETFLRAGKSFALGSTPPMCFLIMFLFQFPCLIRLLASLYVASVLLMCERGVCVHVLASPCPLFMSSLFVASARVSVLCLCVCLPCALRLFFF